MKFAYPSGARPLEGYTLKRGIGVGGFGEVYFAISDAGKEVALKRIQRNLDVELRGVRQCLNLRHVNLISLWDIRTNQQGESWVVMEYVPGESLRDIIEDNPNGMPAEQVKDWFVSTSAGVAYLHDHGIVHRDLKPGNVFYDADQQVIKIGDYGLSKFISCSRRSGQTESVGTFHYMAPEIGKGVYGKEIDIYALGIMLYEMITGQVPFDGESSQEIIMKHLTADPNLDVIPEGFRKVIRNCLVKDPEHRYRNVPEMLCDLPWPEIADKAGEITRHNSVGPLVLAGQSRIRNRAAVKAEEAKQSRRSTVVDAVVASPAPPPATAPRPKPKVAAGSIVFGAVRDLSHHERAEAIGVPVREGSVRVSATGQVTPGTPAPLTGGIHPSVPAEPIAQAMQTGASGVVQWWNTANISTPVKILIVIGASLVILSNSQWLLPLALALGFVYLIYYGIRLWILSPGASSGADGVRRDRPSRVERKAARVARHAELRNWLGFREISDRAIELLGSLLIAAVASIVFNLLGLAITGSLFSASIDSWAQFTWMTLTCIAGSWAVLISAKFWEHRHGSSWHRRVVTSFLGLLVGGVAYLGATSLHVDLGALTADSVNPNFPAALTVEHLPVLATLLVCFTTLFLILRWWKQADPLRTTRLSIWSVGMCVIWGALISHILNLAPLTICIMAVVMSVSIQLAAPWLHPQDRARIAPPTEAYPGKA